MARFDKYEPHVGGFRAPLNVAYTGSANVVGVGINSSGRVVIGAGQTGIVGVIVQPQDRAAGDIVDVMTSGEVVEFGGAAGTKYTAATSDGAVASTAADSTHIAIGYTVEANRLIVRV